MFQTGAGECVWNGIGRAGARLAAVGIVSLVITLVPLLALAVTLGRTLLLVLAVTLERILMLALLVRARVWAVAALMAWVLRSGLDLVMWVLSGLGLGKWVPGGLSIGQRVRAYSGNVPDLPTAEAASARGYGGWVGLRPGTLGLGSGGLGRARGQWGGAGGCCTSRAQQAAWYALQRIN